MAAAEVVVKIVARNLTQRGVKDAEKTIGRLNQAVNQMAFRMKVAGAAAAGVGVLAVREFAQFDRRVREIGTLLGGLTQTQLRELGDEIRQVAIEFGQGFDTMAKARYDIVSAGFTDAAAAATMLRESAKLAVAGVAEVSQTADVLTSALNAYGKSAKDAAHFSDVLFTTVRLGKTTVSELASGLGRVIATAPQAGVSFEELSAAVATLTAVGQSTDEVVTSLNAALIAFINTSLAMEKRLRALGFESGVAAIKALGFAGALKAVTDGASVVELQEMFGNIRAFRAVAPLAGKAAQKFAENLRQMADTAGATQQAVEQMIDSPAMRLARMEQRFKDAMLHIGEALMPVVDGLSTLSEGFAGLDGTTKTAVLGLVGFVAALKFASPIVTAFGTSLGGVLLTVGKVAAPLVAVAGSVAVLADAYRKASVEANALVQRQRELNAQAQTGVPDLVKQLQELQAELAKTDDVSKRLELGTRIRELQRVITARLEEAADSGDAFQREFTLNLHKAGQAAETTSQKVKGLLERFAEKPDFDLTAVYEKLQSLHQHLQETQVELVAKLTVRPDDQELQQELQQTMQDLTATQQALRNLGVRLYPQWAAEADRDMAALSAELLEEQFDELQAGIDQSYLDGLLRRAEAEQQNAAEREQLLMQQAEAYKAIYADELDFQLGLIDLQAERYAQLTKDEVQARRWAEEQKTALVLRHLQRQNALWQSASAAYDTFVRTLINKEMTGKERRERVWEAAQNAFIQFSARMLKEYIANLVARQVAARAAERASVASALATGAAIAQAYSAAATFASTATLGGAAAAGASAILTALATVRAAATFAEGGIVTERERVTEPVVFQPRGTDTVPAMLTPGEAVLPRETVERNTEIITRLLRGETVAPQPPAPVTVSPRVATAVQVAGQGNLPVIRREVVREERVERAEPAPVEQHVTVAPEFHITAVDAAGVEELVRGPEFREALVEAINLGLIRLEAGQVQVKGV